MLGRRASGITDAQRLIFDEISRSRETPFHLGPVATVLADDPATKLAELFEHYVHRFSVATEAYGENLATQEFAGLLRQWGVLAAFHCARLGTDEYSVEFPFVLMQREDLQEPFAGATLDDTALKDALSTDAIISLNNEDFDSEELDAIPDVGEPILAGAFKAIKVLNFNREDRSEIIQHGDDWVARLRRLHSIGVFPQRLLVVIKPPAFIDQYRLKLGVIYRDLHAEGANVVDLDKEDEIRRFIYTDEPLH